MDKYNNHSNNKETYMDMQHYTTQATRTESRINSVIVNMESFKNFLVAFVSIGNIIDGYKKNIFYSRPMNLDTINTHAQTAVKSITSAIREVNSDVPTPGVMVHMNPRTFHAMIGLCTESVELAEAIVKVMDGIPQDDVNIQEEFFDCLWYILVGHDAMQKDITTTLEMGFAKLRSRFPEKFTSDLAINRDTSTERKIMENF